MRIVPLLALLIAVAISQRSHAEDPIFSGPQPEEALPSLPVEGAFGTYADKEFDVVEAAGGKPTLIIFFHERTRPAFGLSNALMRYAATRHKDGLQSTLVMLTDDATETRTWMQNVARSLPQGVEIAISPAGKEGPGAYGLNRNVNLTVLVANEGKVTANFALVQPSIQADGPKVLRAIVDTLGGGEIPDINELAGMQRSDAPPARGVNDPQLATLLRSVINKEATAEQVAQAAEAVEKYVAENEAARRQLGRITQAVTTSPRFVDYGTQPAREVLKKWASSYGTANEK